MPRTKRQKDKKTKRGKDKKTKRGKDKKTKRQKDKRQKTKRGKKKERRETLFFHVFKNQKIKRPYKKLKPRADDNVVYPYKDTTLLKDEDSSDLSPQDDGG